LNKLLTPVRILPALTLIAFGLRMVGLVDVPPRWDEGWSVAHASLSLPELLTLTAADVHPPLFYMLLGLWQRIAGVNLFADRYLSVLMSLPAIPLAFAAAKAWGAERSPRASRMALIAAALMAWLPLGVYYSAVIRMYALAPTFVLLATWAGLRLLSHPGAGARQNRWLIIAFVIGAAGAMYTLYHAVWALAALGVYLALLLLFAPRATRVRRLWTLAGAVGLALLVYLPWALYALPQLQQRAAAEVGNVAQQVSVAHFAEMGLYGLTMSEQVGSQGLLAYGALVVAGVLAWAIGLWRRGRPDAEQSTLRALAMLLLPALAIPFTLFGVAIAARNWAFNARMLIGALPALALLLAWSLDQLARRARLLAGLASLGLIALYWNTSTTLVYEKTLEVFDRYNPHTYAQHLAPRLRDDDVVFYNVLSPAGFYLLDGGSAGWSYALTWDPVIEPRERWEARISAAAQQHDRLWVVLYRGLAGENGDLRGWLDSNFYPAAAEWGEEEVFYGLYGAARAPLAESRSAPVNWRDTNGFDLLLRKAELPAQAKPGEVVPVSLAWQANVPLKQNYKIFVHGFDAAGALVAQHDAQPLNDLRPMSSLPVGEEVVDHHGLALPATFSGSLRVEVGLYDPATGQRIRTADGRDGVELGRVDVQP
jgi:hypothetical protein